MDDGRSAGNQFVILSTGDWWADGHCKWHHLREAFIAIDMTPNEKLWERIVEVIRSYPEPIHGIITIPDEHIHNVAKASKALGLLGGLEQKRWQYQ